MQLQVGVKILLQNDADEVLLIRRCDKKYGEVQQRWDIPGGRIEAGASLMDNLKREVLEETGLQMCEEPILLGAQDIIPEGGAKHVVRLTYMGRALGEVVLSAEHTEYQWMPWEALSELKELDIFLQRLLKNDAVRLRLPQISYGVR